MAVEGRQNSNLPSEVVFAITPNDSTDLAVNTRAISVAVGGDVSLVLLNGTTVTITLPAGLFPIRCSRVRSTGTTATGITGYV